MRRFLALLFVVSCVTSVQAADRDWRGFYAGGTLGYAIAHGNADFSALGIAPLASGSESFSGYLYGAQLGYNFQQGPFVFGVEGDIEASSVKSSSTRVCPAANCVIALTQTSEDSIPWVGSLRGRAGIATGKMLIYATAGAAVGRFESRQIFTSALASLTTVTSTQGVAWVVGAGVEMALSRNWSARVEYRYFDTGKFSDTYSLAGIGAVVETQRMTEQSVRLGLNYRF